VSPRGGLISLSSPLPDRRQAAGTLFGVKPHHLIDEPIARLANLHGSPHHHRNHNRCQCCRLFERSPSVRRGPYRAGRAVGLGGSASISTMARPPPQSLAPAAVLRAVPFRLVHERGRKGGVSRGLHIIRRRIAAAVAEDEAARPVVARHRPSPHTTAATTTAVVGSSRGCPQPQQQQMQKRTVVDARSGERSSQFGREVRSTSTAASASATARGPAHRSSDEQSRSPHRQATTRARRSHVRQSACHSPGTPKSPAPTPERSAANTKAFDSATVRGVEPIAWRTADRPAL